MSFVDEIRKSLDTGLLDIANDSLEQYRPKIITNNSQREENILQHLLRELKTCDYFFLAVAFLTKGGLASLRQTLSDLEKKGTSGKVLISSYLSFSNPAAIEDLNQFSNIEVRLISDKNFHGKCFIFDHHDHSNIMIGSSNLTQDALKKNGEINLNISLLRTSGLYDEAVSTLNDYYRDSELLTQTVLENYKINYLKRSKAQKAIDHALRDIEDSYLIKPNKMQKQALAGIKKQRDSNKHRCLVVSATGTGKSVLSALDVQASNAKRMLFVVHRRTIAKKAMKEFKRVFGPEIKMGLYSGSEQDIDSDFIFSTVQTINSDQHLHRFAKDTFDYIIIDETHRAGAKTYQRIIDYFEPKFLLGMTATPERTDSFNIYELFNHTVGYEIRLQDALEADLLCPFHYYGISDLEVDGELIDESSDFNKLTSHARVNHMIEAINQYGCDSDVIRGLVFCSRKEEAKQLSDNFNKKGFRTIALTGDSSEDTRSDAIKRLESNNQDEKIDLIFSVDIFNEGIDIPSVNLVLMARPTTSAIIFVQQLGRGLRKNSGKEYLTIIDFIGNYRNNYLVPIALFGDSSFNKDKLRKLISSGSSIIPGASTIDFDHIAKEKIFESIDNTNISTFALLKEDYKNLEYRIGRRPMMMDFEVHRARDPYQYIEYSKNLITFEDKVFKESSLSKSESQLLSDLCEKVNNAKRIEDSALLLLLSKNFPNAVSLDEYTSFINSKIGSESYKANLNSVIQFTGLKYSTTKAKIDGKEKSVSISEARSYDLLSLTQSEIRPDGDLERSLRNNKFRKYLIDSSEWSIHKFMSNYVPTRYINGFKLEEKYTRADVFRILDWEKQPIELNVGGYLKSRDNTKCPIFVTYNKADHISDSTKYEDEFISRHEILTISKNGQGINGDTVSAIRKNTETGMRIPLFIKKSDDSDGKDFYFISELSALHDMFEESTMNENKVTRMFFRLNQPLSSNLYHYITSE